MYEPVRVRLTRKERQLLQVVKEFKDSTDRFVKAVAGLRELRGDYELDLKTMEVIQRGKNEP